MIIIMFQLYNTVNFEKYYICSDTLKHSQTKAPQLIRSRATSPSQHVFVDSWCWVFFLGSKILHGRVPFLRRPCLFPFRCFLGVVPAAQNVSWLQGCTKICTKRTISAMGPHWAHNVRLESLKDGRCGPVVDTL